MQLCRGEAARSEMRVRHRKEGERTQWPPTRYVPLLSVRECQGQPHSEPTVATVLDYVSRCLISLRREELPASIDFFPFFYFILSFFLRNLEETTMQAFQTEIDFPSKGKRSRIRSIFLQYPRNKDLEYFYNFCILYYCNNDDTFESVQITSLLSFM